MAAYLSTEGIVVQRSRIRASLHRVDPSSVAKRWSKTVKRRLYKVANPNSLWHMDAHMKLVRYCILLLLDITYPIHLFILAHCWFPGLA